MRMSTKGRYAVNAMIDLALRQATGPVALAAIGARQARRLFQTAEVFDAPEALRIGLLHEAVDGAGLDDAVDRSLHWLGKGGPVAKAEGKRLALALGGMTQADAQREDAANAALIAKLRVSVEGQEGLSAFLDKRAPRWVGS